MINLGRTIREQETRIKILDGLRELRLWHWNSVVSGRVCAGVQELLGQVEVAKTFNDSADFHLKQVQLLNDFFPIDDTAENDASKPVV